MSPRKAAIQANDRVSPSSDTDQSYHDQRVIAVIRRNSQNHRMKAIDADLLARLPLTDIGKVTFYKHDEITTDLICCEVTIDDEAWTFNEEMTGWDMLVGYLESLPGFCRDWFAAASQPPFEASETVAFSR